MVQAASRTKLEVCVDHDFMDAHLLVKLNVDQMWLRPIGPAGVRQVSVRAEERQGWPGTHCQYVSILSSRNCSTPLPGFAVESDQTAMAPISRSSDDLLSICGRRAVPAHQQSNPNFLRIARSSLGGLFYLTKCDDPGLFMRSYGSGMRSQDDESRTPREMAGTSLLSLTHWTVGGSTVRAVPAFQW